MIDGKVSLLIVDEAVSFGGSLVSASNLIRGLDRSRFEPTLVTAYDEAHVRSKLREASGYTKVVMLRPYMHYNRESVFKERIERMSSGIVQKVLIYLFYLFRLTVNLPYILGIAWLILTRKVDLVQLNNSFGNDEVDLLCILLGVPRVMFFRGYQTMNTVERRVTMPGIRAFVSVSKHVEEMATADGIPIAKCTVAMPPQIVEEVGEAELAAVRARYGLVAGQPVFGIFGRVIEWKGQLEFLRAARLVCERFPNAKVFIVGDKSDGGDAYVDAVNELANGPGLKGHVVFTGYVDRVYELYPIMDVVVHSSITPEPAGRVVLEAMSVGVPVVASNEGGPPEMIEDGVDGFICDPRKVEEVAERIGRLLGDDALRRAMGAKAKAKIARVYGIGAFAEHVQSVYLSCLREAPRSS